MNSHRLYQILKTFLQYGLDELLPKQALPWYVRLFRHSLFWLRNKHKDKPLALRFRLAIESLGPVFIKFGQMLSTRRDLLPPDFADELAALQDQVLPFDGEQEVPVGFCRVVDAWCVDLIDRQGIENRIEPADMVCVRMCCDDGCQAGDPQVLQVADDIVSFAVIPAVDQNRFVFRLNQGTVALTDVKAVDVNDGRRFRTITR